MNDGYKQNHFKTNNEHEKNIIFYQQLTSLRRILLL